MFIEIHKVYGRNFRVCSIECVKEMQWRETLSIMNKPYEKPVRISVEESINAKK